MSTDAIHPQAATPPTPPPAPRESWFAAQWSTAKRLCVFLLPIRFSLLALAVVAFAFLISDQGHDIIAAMTEDDPVSGAAVHFWQRVFFVPLVTFLAVQVWYWSRTMLRLCAPGAPSAAEFPRLASFIPRFLGVVAYLIMLGALYRVGREYGKQSSQPLSSLWNLAGWLAAATVLFIIFCIVRRRWLEDRATGKDQRKEVTQQMQLQELATSTRWILAALFLVAVAFFLASCFKVQETGRLGSMAIVLLSLALWVSFGSVLVYLGMRARIPILSLLLLIALASSPFADNHVVPTVKAAPDLLPTRPTAAQAFERWSARLAHDYPGEAKHPVFIVATEGGGIRAAYWTAAVLTALDDDVPGFREHLFAVSGVSGGSVGAAAYAALLTRRADFPGTIKELRPVVQKMLAYDALAPTLAAMTQQDFVQRFIPLPFLPDRAHALEGGWEEAWRDAVPGDDRVGTGFLALMRGREDRMPSFFLNGTAVETGQRIIGSNCRITKDEFAEALDDFEATGADLRVSTTAHNSARFTYISPAGTFLRNAQGYPASPYHCDPGERCEHVVDGGYLDNSGAITAAEILSVVRQSAQRQSLAITPYVIVIQFQAIKPAHAGRKQGAGPVTPPVRETMASNPTPITPERWANEVLSPVRALLNTRDARAVLAVAQLKAQLKEHGDPEAIAFTLRQYPKTIPMPLGWLLSLQTRSAIDAQVGRDAKENGQEVIKVATALSSTATYDDIQHKAATAPAVRQMSSVPP